MDTLKISVNRYPGVLGRARPILPRKRAHDKKYDQICSLKKIYSGDKEKEEGRRACTGGGGSGATAKIQERKSKSQTKISGEKQGENEAVSEIFS